MEICRSIAPSQYTISWYRPLADLPRPWLVVEDSEHAEKTCAEALAFFDAHLQSGDYIVIEDGVVADLPSDIYGR